MSAAAAETRVPAPKTRQSIRLDEVRRLADSIPHIIYYNWAPRPAGEGLLITPHAMAACCPIPSSGEAWEPAPLRKRARHRAQETP